MLNSLNLRKPLTLLKTTRIWLSIQWWAEKFGLLSLVRTPIEDAVSLCVRNCRRSGRSLVITRLTVRKDPTSFKSTASSLCCTRAVNLTFDYTRWQLLSTATCKASFTKMVILELAVVSTTLKMSRTDLSTWPMTQYKIEALTMASLKMVTK